MALLNLIHEPIFLGEKMSEEKLVTKLLYSQVNLRKWGWLGLNHAHN